MKLNLLTVIAVASVLAAGTTFAQDNSGAGRCGQGRGYCVPPQSSEERAARQAACLDKNDGVCPNAGPRAECPGYGQGQGKGRGKGQCQRRGLRDGTGRGSVDGTRPRTGQGR